MKKILIIAGALHIGGAERVAANLSRYAPKDEFEFHYLVFDGYENVYGPEIEARGGKVFSLPSPNEGYLRYVRSLAAMIRENRYSVVHSHTQFNSGLNLAAAKLCGVPIRIAHSHTTKTERKVSLSQKAYEGFMRLLLRRTATHFFACGEEAGVWMFGRKAFSKFGKVVKNGIDLEAYSWSAANREKSRQAYGIPRDAFVIGHAGTLLPLKNQEFLIRLLPKLLAKRPESVLLLLGAGTEEEQNRLKGIADALGVEKAVIFGGGVSNVNELMSAMDVFAFPSLREGTPLALLEAQANGLPCVISDRIPKDAQLTDLICALPLEDEAAWIDRICSMKRGQINAGTEVLAALGYDSASAYEAVYDVYRSIATVSLSFDDGRGDNTLILDELLLPQGIPASLNITTGYVDGSCPEALRPSDKPPMTISELLRFHDHPLVEIAMHGDQHQNTEEDILRGRQKLLEWLRLPSDAKLGFASPGSGLSLDSFRAPEGERLRQSMEYFRTSLRISSLAPLRIMLRKAGRVIHLRCFYRFGYHDTIMTKTDGQILYSVPVMGDASAGQVLALVRDAIRRRGALVLMLHSVSDDVFKNDNWTWKREKLETLCRALKRWEREGKLSLCKTIDQYHLLQRRS